MLRTKNIRDYSIRLLDLMPAVWAFMLPFNQKLSPVPLFLWGLLSFLFFDRKRIHFGVGGPVLCAGFFVVTWYAAILDFSLLDSLISQETRYSFLAVPILFILNGYTSPKFSHTKYFFVYGNIVALSILLLRALYFYFLGDASYFWRTLFCYFHQTVYTAFHFIVCFALVLNKQVKFSGKKVMCGVASFFLLGIFLISNRAGFLSLFLAVMVYVFRLGFISGLKKIWIVVLLVFLFMKFNPRMKYNYDRFNWHGRNEHIVPRITIWKACIEILKNQKPFWGLGSERVQDELNKVYNEWNFKGAQYDWSAHNQYLNFVLSAGVVGLVFVALLLFYMFKYAWYSEYRAYYLMLCVVFFTEILFEKMSGRYSGVSLISFILTVLFYQPYGKKHGEKDQIANP